MCMMRILFIIRQRPDNTWMFEEDGMMQPTICSIRPLRPMLFIRCFLHISRIHKRLVMRMMLMDTKVLMVFLISLMKSNGDWIG